MTGTLSSWKFKLQTIANEYASEQRIYRRPGQQIQTPSSPTLNSTKLIELSEN